MSEKTANVTVNITEDQTIVELSKLTQQYRSEIFLKREVRGSIIEVNLKSFLGLITLNLSNDIQLQVRAIGDDSAEALQAVVQYLTGGH